MKFVGFFALSFFGLAAVAAPVHLPHMDLEMESSEYRAILKKGVRKDEAAKDPAIAKGLKWGERLSAWLAHENARRSPSEALRLTSPGTRRGIPIDKPSIYSERTIAEDLVKHAAEMPANMMAVLEGGAFPTALPLPDADFILLARKVDKTYQSAARFKSLIGWRSFYVARKAQDVRSYHFFTSNGWTADRISRLGELTAEEQSNVRQQLVELCLNSGAGRSSCVNRVAREENAGTLPALFTTLMGSGERVWRSFFDIPRSGVRRDVDHTNANRMVVPFNTPSIERFRPYLQDNVEAEFQWGTWQLLVNFGSFMNGPRLEFRAGTVPHVNGLGGNVITMDSNQPIEEYESQWTIRHEFGHVIGLPDCYHEFYDESLRAFVNYQLDIKDLMCSRAGDMTERIFLELKRVYFR
jgi:hypothetical protein